MPPPTAPPGKQPMSRAEIADYLQVSRGTVRRITESGELPATKIGRRVVAFKEDCDAWLDKIQGAYRSQVSNASRPASQEA